MTFVFSAEYGYFCIDEFSLVYVFKELNFFSITGILAHISHYISPFVFVYWSLTVLRKSVLSEIDIKQLISVFAFPCWRDSVQMTFINQLVQLASEII